MLTSTPQTLADQLDELRQGHERLPAEVQALMQEKAAELARSGIAESSLGVSDKAPDFELPNAVGARMQFSQLLQGGPVVLSFYRGGWCPFCNLELRALQQILPEIERLGASLVAVSPELPDASLNTLEKHELQFQVLSDQGNRVARQFGLVFTVAEELRPVYEQFGIDIPAHNGDQSFELPLPVTYVIASDGTIRYAFVNSDYTQRAEPADIIAACAKIAS